MEVYRFRHIYEHAWFGVTKVKVENVDTPSIPVLRA
jgi:hypothetical protein